MLSFSTASESQAGCFDGWCCSSKPAGPPIPVGSPFPVSPTVPVSPVMPSNGGMTSYYGNFGMMPPTSGSFLPAGFPQPVVSAMPTAGFDTQWQRTPVTYYRPVTQFDPNYGTTVTSLQPCTSFQYQAQRVPLMAPAPIGGPTSMEANRWPGVNAPGFYPTGMMATQPMQVAAVPTYPAVQQVPATGMNFAMSGPSSVPTSTIPMRTMSYGSYANSMSNSVMPPASTVATSAPVSTAVFMGAPGTTVPAAAWSNPSSFSSVPTSSVAGQTVVQAGAPVYSTPSVPWGTTAVPFNSVSSLSPSGQPVANCVNGVCPPSNAVTSAMPIPNIPGATVVPFGPPTILNGPTTSSVTPNSNGIAPSATQMFGPTPVLPGASLPSTGQPGAIPGASQTYNPGNVNPVLPPGATSSDPEAMSQPSLGTSAMNRSGASNQVAQLVPMQRLPLVEIDRSAANDRRSASMPSSAISPVGLPSPFGLASNEDRSAPLALPAPPTTATQNPIAAPDNFDAAPRWNSKRSAPSTASPSETVASNPKLKSASYQRMIASEQSIAPAHVASPSFRPVTGP